MTEPSDNKASSASPVDTVASEGGDAEVFPIAPMDKAVKISTILMIIFLALLSVALVFMGIWLPQVGGWLFLLAGLVAVGSATLVVLIRIYSRPQGFEVSPEGIRIVWPGRSRKLPKAAFAEMRLVTRTELGPLTRRFGLRGIWGCFGWFTSEYMGNMDAYVTCHDSLVYLRLKNRRPLLLTPQNAEQFLATLKDVVEGEG